jgi:hypothetical protein
MPEWWEMPSSPSSILLSVCIFLNLELMNCRMPGNEKLPVSVPVSSFAVPKMGNHENTQSPPPTPCKPTQYVKIHLSYACLD